MLDFSSLFELRADLHRAIASNNIEQLRELFSRSKHQVNLNYIDREGQSPLHRSCTLGFKSIVEYLCESGASQNLKNKEGWFPIHLAAYYGHMDIVFYLKQLGQRNNDIAVFQEDEEEDDDNDDDEEEEEEEKASSANESDEDNYDNDNHNDDEEHNELLFLFNFSSLKL